MKKRKLGYAPGSGSALRCWAKGHTGGIAPVLFTTASGGAKPRLTSGGRAVRSCGTSGQRGCKGNVAVNTSAAELPHIERRATSHRAAEPPRHVRAARLVPYGRLPQVGGGGSFAERSMGRSFSIRIAS